MFTLQLHDGLAFFLCTAIGAVIVGGNKNTCNATILDKLTAQEKSSGAEVEEEKQARYRFTESRLAKAVKDGSFDVIVIGSGPSSMACAASLARMGKRCCVLEQGEQIGGGAHVFSLKGYEFETGVHYLGNDVDMERMLSFASCGRLKMAPIGTVKGNITVHDEVFVGPNSYNFATDTGKQTVGTKARDSNFAKMLMATFPKDVELIKRFLCRIETLQSPAYKEACTWYFRLKAPHFLPAWLRGMLQRKLGNGFWEMSQLTAEEFVKDCGIDVTSELGCVVLGQYGDAGVRPDKLSAALFAGVVAHYINGSTYPIGGSGAIPRKLNAVIRAAGGCSFVQGRVTELLTEDGGSQCVGVKVNGSVEIRASQVISGIGAIQSFSLLEKHRPIECKSALANLRINHEYSVAFIFLFIALDITDQPEEDRDHSSHNRWIYPERNYTKMEKEIETSEPWSRPMPMFVASGSSKDATWTRRHGANKKTVMVLSQCPWDWVREWASLNKDQRDENAAYQSFKAKTTEAMMEQGFRRCYSHLEKYIIFTEVGTPLTTNNFLSTYQGECYGMAATPGHWGKQELTPYTPCKNYLMTGQDIGTLGVAGSISSGYLTANVAAGYGGYVNALLMREIATDLGLDQVYK